MTTDSQFSTSRLLLSRCASSFINQFLMSECLCESTRSQYSFLDQNLSVYSTSSRNRQGKYFTRKPIENYSPRTTAIDRKHRDCSDFIGFYSPTHKNEALTQRGIYEKAMRNDLKKFKPNLEGEEGDRKTELKIRGPESDEIVEMESVAKKSFRKKKPEIPMGDLNKEQKIIVKEVRSDGGQAKENPEKVMQQLESVVKENCQLRKELQSLRVTNAQLQLKITQLTNNPLLNSTIAQLKLDLAESRCSAIQLQSELQSLKTQHSLTSRTLQNIYTQSIQSLTHLNSQLKLEVYGLQQNLKYAGIEISILRKSDRKEEKENGPVVAERNTLKRENRELKGELARLKQVREREREMWRDWEEREEVELSISDSEGAYEGDNDYQ